LAELAQAAQCGDEDSQTVLDERILYLTQLSSDLKERADAPIPWNDEAFSDLQALVLPLLNAPQGSQQALGAYLSALDEAIQSAPAWVSSAAEPWIEALLDYAAAFRATSAFSPELLESSESLGQQIGRKKQGPRRPLRRFCELGLREENPSADDSLEVLILEREIQKSGLSTFLRG